MKGGYSAGLSTDLQGTGGDLVLASNEIDQF